MHINDLVEFKNKNNFYKSIKKRIILFIFFKFNNLIFFNLIKNNFFNVLILILNFDYKFFSVNYKFEKLYKTKILFNSNKNSKLIYSYIFNKPNFFNFLKLNGNYSINSIKFIDNSEIFQNLIYKDDTKTFQKDVFFLFNNMLRKDIKTLNLKKKTKLIFNFFKKSLSKFIFNVSFFNSDYLKTDLIFNTFNYKFYKYKNNSFTFNFHFTNSIYAINNFISFYNIKSKYKKKKTIFFLKKNFNIKNKNKKIFNYKFSNISSKFFKKVYIFLKDIYLYVCVKSFFKTNSFVMINKVNFYNYNLFLKKALFNLMYLNDLNYFTLKINKFSMDCFTILSNKFFSKNIPILNGAFLKNKYFYKMGIINNINVSKNKYYYNNYYPVIYLNKPGLYKYKKKVIISKMNTFYTYFQNLLICFFENFFKKKISLTITNNYFRKTYNIEILSTLINDNKYYKPFYMKNYSIIDFIEIFWYSLFLKDLKMISTWMTKFMESIHFRYHKRFLSFFGNFIKKYGLVFINYLNVKGFFFDIRGKVGVAGNSKKRHLFFKVGTLKKSTKKSKINFNQNLVRTPVGVLGLTYILNY